MKKVAFCAAAAAMCGSLLAVESANIVGYTTVDLTGSQYNCVTPGFKSTSVATDTFQMKDIQPSSFDESSDILQLLNSTQARTVKTYFFYDGAWYEDVDDWNDADEDTFDVLQGFLGNFAAKDVAFTSAGGVLLDPSQLDCKTDALQYVMVGNPLPVDLTFKDIEVVSYDESSDILQLLNNTQARTIKTYFAYGGDWYEDVDDWNDAADDPFPANTAMLGNFAAKDVVLNFPGAL